jgi:hypothetical protein
LANRSLIGHPATGRNFQNEISAQHRKDEVGRPGSERGRKLAQVSHGFEEARDHLVNARDPNRYRNSGNSSPLPSGQREGNGEHCHHQRDHGNGKFPLQLNFQAHHIKAALLQVVDVAPQLLKTHLRRLFHFFFEVGGRFAELLKGGDIELVIALDRTPFSLRTSLVRRCSAGSSPKLGVKALGDGGSAGIELEDGRLELVAVCVERL